MRTAEDRPRVAAIVVAGGSGQRIGGEPKQFRTVGGRPMLAWSLARFASHPAIDQVVAVVPAQQVSDPPTWLVDTAVSLVAGGASRRASVGAGLRALGTCGGPVLIHDAARPFVSAELVDRLLAAAARGPVIPVLPLADAVKRMRGRRDEDGRVIETTLDRDRLRAAQTPQVFPGGLIGRLHEEAAAEHRDVADDASLCEAAGVPVSTVPGERWAFKITVPEDLAIADWLVESGRVAWPGRGAG